VAVRRGLVGSARQRRGVRLFDPLWGLTPPIIEQVADTKIQSTTAAGQHKGRYTRAAGRQMQVDSAMRKLT
jgi:hypothetical protein